MALLILVGRRSVSHFPIPCDLVTWQSIKEWPKLGLGSSLAFWVVETVDGAITLTWLVVLSQISIDALNSYGQLLFDKDITLTIVLFITILQNKQNASCFVTIDSCDSRRIDIIVKAMKSFRVRGNVIDENFVKTSGCSIFLHIVLLLGWSVIIIENFRKICRLLEKLQGFICWKSAIAVSWGGNKLPPYK